MSDWIEWHWTPEKQYPETLDTVVVTKFPDGSEGFPDTVRFWHMPGGDRSSWHPAAEEFRITHYRVVEAA